MSDTKSATGRTTNDAASRTTGFWEKNGKGILILVGIVVLGIGGFLAYKNMVQLPKEEKAAEAMFKAEEYFREDSLSLALNGDGITSGFLKVIERHKGTKAANLAHYYAGVCYLNQGEYENALKHLKAFKSGASDVLKARALGLLGDASSELDKKDAAVDYYKKAAAAFTEDSYFSSEYLFRAGYLLESLGKNKDAAEQYKKIKDQYPNTQRGYDIDKYLARLGEINE